MSINELKKQIELTYRTLEKADFYNASMFDYWAEKLEEATEFESEAELNAWAVEMLDNLTDLSNYHIREEVENFLTNFTGLVKCDSCGEYHAEEDLTYTADGSRVCQDCLDNYYFYCEYCGEYHDCDYAVQVKVKHRYNEYTEYWCQDCADRYAFRCCQCGEYFSINDFEEIVAEDTGDSYCQDCADNWLHYCDNCCNYFVDGVEEYGDSYLCEDCAEECGYNLIQSYHNHKNSFLPIRNKKDMHCRYNHLIGFELEVDNGSDSVDCAKDLQEAFGDYLVFENDGSLTRGFEIISQPLSINCIRSFDFNKLKDICRGYDFKSHDTDTCGLHLHFNRAMFGSTKEAQDRTIAKLITFYNIFYSDMVKLSRRKSGELHWAERYYNNNGEALKIDTKELKNKRGRYYAVNNDNRSTVEFRLGKGTLNPDTIRAWIEFHYRLVLNAKKIKWSDVNDVNKWLQGMPEIVVAYMEKREAFGFYEGGAQ